MRDLQEPEIRAAAANGVEAANAPNTAANAAFSGVWSGDLNKGLTFGASESTVTVSFAEDGEEEAAGARQLRGDELRPIWLRESTVDGAASTADSVTQVTQQMAPGRAPGLNFAPTEDGSASKDEIMATLLLHEKRTARPSAVGRARGAQQKAAHKDASSSDNDDSDSGGDSEDELGRGRGRQLDSGELEIVPEMTFFHYVLVFDFQLITSDKWFRCVCGSIRD